MPEPPDPDLVPVDGVSLELFARISRELAAFRYDVGEASRIAERHGVAPATWQLAATTWAQRLRANSVVAEAFRTTFELP